MNIGGATSYLSPDWSNGAELLVENNKFKPKLNGKHVETHFPDELLEAVGALIDGFADNPEIRLADLTWCPAAYPFQDYDYENVLGRIRGVRIDLEVTHAGQTFFLRMSMYQNEWSIYTGKTPTPIWNMSCLGYEEGCGFSDWELLWSEFTWEENEVAHIASEMLMSSIVQISWTSVIQSIQFAASSWCVKAIVLWSKQKPRDLSE